MTLFATPERRRGRWLLFATLVGVACARLPAVAGEARPAAPRPRSVFVIVLDAASARYFGAYGAPAHGTPDIDALGRQSVVFGRAYSQSSKTTPSVASLFTGVRVTTHRATLHGFSPELVTLAEILREAGFSTVGVSANPNAGLRRTQLDRGFDRFVGVWKSRADRDGRGTLARQETADWAPRARAVTQAAQQLSKDAGAEGLFAYIHYLQPHQPYDAAASFQREFPLDPGLGCALEETPWRRLHRQMVAANRSGRSSACLTAVLEARYRANLRRVDSEVGRLLDWLREQRLFDESLVVLTADHGEAFFGHKRFGHSAHLYDDMTRVPLVVKFPDSAAIAPRRITSLVETIDLLPTLLDFLGIAPAAQLEGRSLMPEIRGAEPSVEAGEVVMATVSEVPLHAIRSGDHKYIHAQGQPLGELYDLGSDPAEQRNLIELRPQRARSLRERLTALTGIDPRAAGETHGLPSDPDAASEPDPAAPLDPEIEALLEKLGYAR